ncbi:MAG: phosphatidate cytidylyltransferase [Flavobacterium sp.]
MTTTVTRALSGAVYVLLFVSATLYSPYSFLLLTGILLLFSVMEFCKLLRIQPYVSLILAIIGFILFNLDNTVKINELLLLAAALMVSVKSLVFLFEKKSVYLDKTSKYVFMMGYLIIPLIIFVKIPFVNNTYEPKIIIGMLVIIWTNDTFAYLVGRAIGKHKLFEKVSPKKTIEGFMGGVIFSVISGIIVATAYIKEPVLKWVAIAVIVCVFGTLGDLIESKFKRNANVKDSGAIMPGHGGFLDRLDSIIFASPFVYLFYQILHYVP